MPHGFDFTNVKSKSELEKWAVLQKVFLEKEIPLGISNPCGFFLLTKHTLRAKQPLALTKHALRAKQPLALTKHTLRAKQPAAFTKPS